jgi:hypothetical protein
MPQLPHLDRPNVRSSVVCPICRGNKAIGNLVCVPCWNKEQMRFGNPDALYTIDEAEGEMGGAIR